MNLLTVIVLIIFALCILRGYRRGFVKSLASMASLVLSIILVNFATPYVSEFLQKQTPVYDYILKKCEDAFSVDNFGQTQNEGQKDDAQQAEGAGQTEGAQEEGIEQENTAPAWQEGVIDALPVPEVLKNLLKQNNTPQYYRQLAAKSFEEYVPRYMAGLILNICSFLATLVLVISFIWLAVMMLDMITSLPVIHGINQILGLALGFLQGLIIVWVALLIITIFSHTDAGRQLMRMITESPILSALYDHNILLDFLQNTVQKLI